MHGWFYLFFFLSGLTGLIFETAFARQLHLTFGSTLTAVSLVLAVYLGGMALGAAFLGPRADRISSLRLYGMLEIGIGLCALIAVILIPQIRNLYAYLCASLPLSPTFRSFVQGILAIIVLLPSTVLMGATLPAVSRGLTASIKQRFCRIGALYGLNTVGAAFGTLLCGFLLLELLGYLRTVMAAATVNVTIGFLALAIARRRDAESLQVSEPNKKSTEDEKRATVKAEEVKLSGLQKLLLILAGVSGLAALGYEVVWFRVLSFSIVADAHAFALMLGIYLIGIGGGSLVALWRFRGMERKREESSGLWIELGLLEILIAVLVAVGFAVWVSMSGELPRLNTADPVFWWKSLGRTSLQALILILPATLILGYVFPLLLSLYTSRMERFGRQVGRIYASNTAGAIIGILGSGFILIPWIGMQKSLIVLAGLSAVVGIIALAFSPLSARARFTALGFGGLACVLAFSLIPIRPHFGFLQIPAHKDAKLLFYHEGCDHTVMVTEDRKGWKIRRLLLNQQQATATGLAGQRKNQLLGHLPLWACPEAKKALVICFGSGGTFGALGLYDLERVDCVEICSSVINAASYFSEWNGDVLSRPHAKVIIDDGRSYLHTTKEYYDIITLEPMHPGLKGVSTLYSTEFYQEARERLNPGGALCQWVPLYSMSGQDARSLIATELEIFPQSCFWLVGTEGILLCARDSLKIDWRWLNNLVGREDVQQVLRRVRLDDPWAILSGYLLGPEGLRQFVGGARFVRDDRPFTEYTIPRHQHVDPWDDILKLAESRESPLPLLEEITPVEREDFIAEWEEKKPAWIDRDRGFAAFQQGDFPKARKLLEAAYEVNPEDRYSAYFLKELYWRYGIEFTRRGFMDEAIQAYRRACEIEPEDPDSHFYLAVAYDNAGLQEESIAEAEIAVEMEPNSPEAQRFLARISPRH